VDIELEPALAELKKQGISVSGPDQKLLDISRNNGKSPAAIYKLLKPLEGKTPSETPKSSVAPTVQQSLKPATPVTPAVATQGPTLQVWTADLVQKQFEGKGVGRKTLSAICAEYGLDQGAIIRKLAAKNITMASGDTLKKIADERSELPIEVLKIILIGEKK
jgi:hypothetical protein